MCDSIGPRKCASAAEPGFAGDLLDRRIGVDQVILAGMSANLCTESHMHELPENGF